MRDKGGQNNDIKITAQCTPMGKKKNNILLSDREYKYWITRNCARAHSWVVVARFGEIISHDNKTLIDCQRRAVDWQLDTNKLDYVYAADLTPKSLLSVIESDNKYYLIKNINNTDTGTEKDAASTEKTDAGTKAAEDVRTDYGTKPFESTICVGSSLDEIVSFMNAADRKRLKIKKRTYVALSTKEKKELKGVVNIDFIGKSIIEQKRLWETFFTGCTDGILDLSGFYLLDPRIMRGVTQNTHIITVILYQNNKITNFEWLTRIPKLKTLSIWYSNMLENEHLEKLILYAPHIQELELHHCYMLDGKILLPLSKLRLLSKLMFDNRAMIFQKNSFYTVLSVKEWEQIDNSGLELLLIDSENLTPDVTQQILLRFKKINHLIVSETVTKALYDNTLSGYETDKIIIQSKDNPKHAFIRYRTLKFLDLLCNRMEMNAYSDSMMKKMKELNPDIADQFR